ncbi:MULTISPECIES: hypothetical protein [unclassified Meiothermus]|uniref:hypothetical protein n=1 Tax=unclassified Meiothermus TaxID=370471 RepID=UPI000D7BF549|nr:MULTISPECIES: hypothetical protein [unclassified Meiothermus]PZA06183.1 hypothetical protein DNA98_14555 [Meiothermus sp. Pnk-1]RYM37481.1 hypothetical protein EWH23_06165 [Meiothermus sp. PNK-Is4]
MLTRLRILRAYWIGHRDSKALAKKHASLAYLTPNPYPGQLKERFGHWMEGVVRRYLSRRGHLEERLNQVRHQRKALERIVGQDEPTPEVFAHVWGYAGRYGLLAMVFFAELVFNKLAMDTLELSQMEAYIVAFIATLTMFWLGHEAGNQYRKGHPLLAAGTAVFPVLIAVTFAVLRAEFSRRMAEVQGDPLPSPWTLPALLILGLGLVAFTFFLGYKSPHERESLMRRLFLTARAERRLWARLQALHRSTERTLDQLLAYYREIVAAYWRGFARAWPRWDPAPEFVGYVPPLNRPALPPLDLEPPTDPLTREDADDRLVPQPRP